MNDKILETLEYRRITARLSHFAVTQPAKAWAQKLRPSSDFDEVSRQLKQTLALATILRVKGPLPITNFDDISSVAKRLKIRADLNRQELGNLLLILTLGQNVTDFTSDLAERELDMSAIETSLKALSVPKELFHALQKSLEFDGTLLDTASSRLAQIRHDLNSNEIEVKQKMNDYLQHQAKYLSENIITIRDSRYVLPVKAAYRAKFGGVVHDQSASGQTLFIEPEPVLGLNNRQQGLLADEKKEIHQILHHLSLLAADEQTELLKIANSLTALDFMSAKAKLAKEMKATEPRLSVQGEIELRQARHPLLDPEKVVANDIQLGVSFDTMLITGPNTGGKTLTLKTLGLLELMAQSGLFIPADEDSRVAVFEQVYADIGDEQSIEQSLSTFSSHIDNIIHIMAHANAHDLILIDELGAGTDPEEGASLAIAILDELHRSKAKIAVTTHYPELKLYGYNKPRTINASMAFDLKTLSPTYRLQIGIPGESNAFAIAGRLGMSAEVITRAKALIKDDDSDLNQMIAKLNTQTKAVTDERQQLEEGLVRSQKLQQRLQQALDWYAQRVDQQLAFAQEKADRIIQKRRQQAQKIIDRLEAQAQNGVAVKTNQVIAAKGAFNALQEQTERLSENKVLKREKKRHEVKVGDEVKVLSYGQSGTITQQLGPHDFEVQIGIIKAKVSDRDVEKVDRQKVEKKTSHPISSTRTLKRSSVHSQLDLRGQRYDEAIANLDRYLDGALLAGLETVLIIHGIGTGAIRHGVWQYLKKSRHVKQFDYAPANEGGNGATIVVLK